MVQILRNFLTLTPAIIIAIYFHEIAHARLFKKTTESKRDFSLIGCVDPLGLLMYYIFQFGWSRPFPINYWKLKKHGLTKTLFTIISGPAVNLFVGIAAALLFKYSGLFKYSTFFTGGLERNYMLSYLSDVLYWIMVVNLKTSLFNLLPFPPLDGARLIEIATPDNQVDWLAKFEVYGLLSLVVLSILGIIQLIMWPVSRLVEFITGLII
ncbi:peptidase M50 [Kosmotoga arenicorallina S304]|uniref:Peptidase M50 n=1 Tax=Kosmotoga arenicorallina S304 TaxID=1453497 RepID=A0A176K335_9BACT|nr:site-2 protease family protein [Kosmotoga arenicorallina]OAA31392.1 peptidase M50 [Kosmotoga arenicorallina S304]